jgi:hypothetical protein
MVKFSGRVLAGSYRRMRGTPAATRRKEDEGGVLNVSENCYGIMTESGR